ncbi:MAG: hypothetical protein ILP19_02635 [Oscillospiraceae bacterium]|nr:hypothetical protein [Oscillospiraceae bacterium]
MKEKYAYESVKEIATLDAVLLFGGIILFCYLMIKHDYLESRTILILVFIIASLWCCFIGRIVISMRFAADDNAVTFSRIFTKRIAYSSIKSIDLRTEKRTYKTKEGMRHIRHTYHTEIITFHCEDGDHSFAGRLDPKLKTLTSVSSSDNVSPDDMTYSPFSRLKIYIEDRINAN